MRQLAGSIKQRLAATAWLAAAACSINDWPGVSAGDGGSSSAGSESNFAAAGGGSGGTAFSTTGVTPYPAPISGSGEGGPIPLDAGASRPDGGSTAGADGESPLSDPDAGSEAVEPPPDASTEPPVPSEPEFMCDGTPLGDSCWYLGDVGESCNDVCAARGGFAPSGAAAVGTPAQGGSLGGCSAVLEALIGFSGVVREGYRDDGRGLGCHVYEEDGLITAWWLTSPELSPDVSLDDVRVVCGCAA